MRIEPKILDLTAQIAAAHVTHNAVQPSDVPGLITSIAETLGRLAKGEPEPEELVPAVSIRTSVKPDHITCLECGVKSKMLKRHLATAHDLTPDEYRERWKLAPTYPMVAPNYAEVRRKLAKSIGLGRHPNAARGRKAA